MFWGKSLKIFKPVISILKVRLEVFKWNKEAGNRVYVGCFEENLVNSVRNPGKLANLSRNMN